MFSSLPKLIQSFLALPQRKRRQQQLQYDTLKLLQLLREGRDISLKQLLYVLQQILNQQNTIVSQYFTHLQNLVANSSEPTVQIRLNQSRRDSRLHVSKTVRNQVQSDLVNQFNKINSMNQQNQVNEEINLLDNIVMNAIQTQSVFLKGLEDSIVDDSTANNQVRTGDTIHIGANEQVRSGDNIDINAQFPDEDTGDANNMLLSHNDGGNVDNYEDVFTANEDLLHDYLTSSTVQKKPTRGRQSVQDTKIASRKSKVTRFQFFADEVAPKQNNIEFQTISVLNPNFVNIIMDKNQGQLEQVVLDEEQIEEPQEVHLSVESHERQDDASDGCVSSTVGSNQFVISHSYAASPSSLQQLREYSSIKQIAGNKFNLIVYFIEALQQYKDGKVEMLQKGGDVFVKGCQ